MPPIFTPEEWGRPHPAAIPVDPTGQPRGEARLPLPHVTQFMGITNWAGRNYNYMHDEAMAHNRENAERCRLDPVIDACMKLLVYPIAMLTQHIDPDDMDDPWQIDCAAKVQTRMDRLPRFHFMKRWLLDNGTWVGRSGVKVRWQFERKRDFLWHLPTGFEPVHGDKLVYHWDGRVGILVNSMFDLPTEPSERGRVYYLTPEEREQFILHTFEPEDVSFYKPHMAGAVHGRGLRNALYWLWALKNRVWSMGMDFLQWFARGLTVFYFPGGNDKYANEVRQWIEQQDGSQAMMLPWFPNIGDAGYKPVERFEASTASPQFIQALITQYFDDLIKLIILGQSLTSGTASTGLGSGVAAAHQMTFENRVKYHAVALGDTLSSDLLGPVYRANFPGTTPGRWVLEVDDPNVQQMLENAELLYEMGAAIPEGALLDSAGIPEVKPNDTILTQVNPMQPAATGGMPDGVPVMEGQPVQGGGGPPPGAEPVKMSMLQYGKLLNKAIRGDRLAKKLFRTRRVMVKGWNC